MTLSDAMPALQLVVTVRAPDHGARRQRVGLSNGEFRPLASGITHHDQTSRQILIHETFVNLFQGDALQNIGDGAHFVAVAAQVLRRILSDHAYAEAVQNRGARIGRVPLDDRLAIVEDAGIDLLNRNEAIEALSAKNERRHSLIQINYFAGLTQAQIAKLHKVLHTAVDNAPRAVRTYLKTVR